MHKVVIRLFFTLKTTFFFKPITILHTFMVKYVSVA